MILIRFSCDNLNDACGNVEAGIIVGPDRPQRLNLWEPRDVPDHFIQGVIAVAEIVEVISHPAAHVGEKMPDGHVLGNLFVVQLEILEVSMDRRVQVHFVAFRQLHQQGARKGLRDRSDLEESIRRDRQGVLHTRDAETREELLSLMPDANGDAGHLQTLHLGPNLSGDLAECRVLDVCGGSVQGLPPRNGGHACPPFA